MRWDDEPWMKVYTRDTVNWLALSYDARSLFLQLLRKVDRAGMLAMGRHGRRGIAILLGALPQWESIVEALVELEADGCVRVESDVLSIPNFRAAQDARQSDAARKAAQRERDAARDAVNPSRDVTSSHTPSQDVTIRIEENRSEENRSTAFPGTPSPAPQVTLPGIEAPRAVAPKAAKAPKMAREATGDPRHHPTVDRCTRAFLEANGSAYGFRGVDARKVTEALALADQDERTRGEAAPAEVERRWRIGLAERWGDGTKPVQSLTALVTRWNECAEARAPPGGSKFVSASTSKHGKVGEISEF